MNILHIGKYYPPFHGGIENFMNALIEQQIAEGHSVSAMVHHHHKTEHFYKDSIGGANIYRVPIIGNIAYAPIAPSFLFRIGQILKKENPDIIHIHTPNLSAFWCLFVLAARKKKWVIQWQSDVLGAVPDIKIKMLYPLYRFFESALLRKSSKVIVATPPYAKTSKPLNKFKDKVEVIPLGIVGKKHENIVQSTMSNDSTIELLIIGRLTYYKGHSVLLNALYLLNRNNIAINLTIIGSGELNDVIKQQVAELGLQENVQMLGKLSHEELEKELIKTDLLCLPSIERTEAFGVVLLEAMRASKACLVSDVEGSGMSWVVEDNKTGFVVKHNDVNSLVERLTYIADNPSLLTKYGKAGRVRFEQHFLIENVSQKVTQLYKSILT